MEPRSYVYPQYSQNPNDPRLVCTRGELLENHMMHNQDKTPKIARPKRFKLPSFGMDTLDGVDVKGHRYKNATLAPMFTGTLWTKAGCGSLVKDLLMSLEEPGEEFSQFSKDILDYRTDLLLTTKDLDEVDVRRVKTAISVAQRKVQECQSTMSASPGTQDSPRE
jgi:hypothetical protein